MYAQLKSEIKEIIEIVNQCPEALQEKCFETLLENYLSTMSPKKQPQKEEERISTLKNDESNQLTTSTIQEAPSSEEIALNNFHIKVKKFLQDNKIDAAVLNKLYYKENGSILPLYDSLKSTRMSECQIRLALLTAFENSYSDGNGEMRFNGEVVRQRCQDMKCYDTPNFSSIFKKNSKYFDNWNEKYDKTVDYVLSAEGKKELANTLLDLEKGE